jgi:hypothetical protein
MTPPSNRPKYPRIPFPSRPSFHSGTGIDPFRFRFKPFRPSGFNRDNKLPSGNQSKPPSMKFHKSNPLHPLTHTTFTKEMPVFFSFKNQICNVPVFVSNREKLVPISFGAFSESAPHIKVQ